MLPADDVWYRDVSVLWRRAGEFFPCRDQSPEERVNSLVRLVLYCTLAVFALRRRPGHLAFGLGAAAVITLAYGGGRDASASAPGGGRASRAASMAGRGVTDVQRARRRCTASTPDNPFANMLPSDPADRPPACPYDEQADLIRRNFERGLVRNVYDVYDKETQGRWMTAPVTTMVPDVAAFAQFAYGNVGRKTCREDPSKCLLFGRG